MRTSSFSRRSSGGEEGGKQVEPPPHYERLKKDLAAYDSVFGYPRPNRMEIPFGLGLAIFSKASLRNFSRKDLPPAEIAFEFGGVLRKPSHRLMISVETDIEGRALRLINTHLQAFFMINASSNDHHTQRDRVEVELRKCSGATLLGGDFNCAPGETLIEQFKRAGFHPSQNTKVTWRRMPFVIDHIFYNYGLRLEACAVIPTPASDHHAVRSEFSWVKLCCEFPARTEAAAFRCRFRIRKPACQDPVPDVFGCVSVKLGCLADVGRGLQVVNVVADDLVALRIVDHYCRLALVEGFVLSLYRDIAGLLGCLGFLRAGAGGHGCLSCCPLLRGSSLGHVKSRALLGDLPLPLGRLVFGNHIGHSRGERGCSERSGYGDPGIDAGRSERNAYGQSGGSSEKRGVASRGKIFTAGGNHRQRNRDGGHWKHFGIHRPEALPDSVGR